MSRTNYWFKELLALLLVFIGIIFILNNFSPSTHLVSIVLPVIYLSVGGFILIEHYSEHRKSTNWVSCFFGYLLCIVGLILIIDMIIPSNLRVYNALKYIVAIDVALFLTLLSFKKRIVVFLAMLMLTITLINILTLCGLWAFALPIILLVLGSYLFIKIPHREK